MKPLSPSMFAIWRWKGKFLFLLLLLLLIPLVTYSVTTPPIWYLTYYDAPKLHRLLEDTYYAPANWFFENSKTYRGFWICEAHLVYGE